MPGPGTYPATARFRRLPLEIEAVEFDGILPVHPKVRVRFTSDGGWEVRNELHRSWIRVKKGDFLRVDSAPGDVYPIDRAVFHATYEPVET